MPDGDAAGDCKGVVLRAANQNRSLAGGKRTAISAFVRSAPLLGFFWPFSCRNKKRAYNHRNDKLKFDRYGFL